MPPSRRHTALLAIASLLCVAMCVTLTMADRSWGQTRTLWSQVAPPAAAVSATPATPATLTAEHAHTGASGRSSIPADPAAETPAAETLALDPPADDHDSVPLQLDRFDALHARMDGLRQTFSRHLATALHTLPRDDRYCPDDVAVPYYKAWLAGRGYETLGLELEALHQTIQRQSEPGARGALSPDQRWKVEQARLAYHSALVDYGEMRAAMAQHLEPEMRFRRCRPDALLRQGARQVPAGLSASAPPAHMAATFFIDNRACGDSFDLIVDGALLGKVSAHRKVALQTTAGRHRLCLIEASSALACGAPGTVRMAHVYDGWTITTHCR